MRFKKGQIIPRWTGVKVSDRKAQHKVKFGCDVSFEDGVFYLESQGAFLSINANVINRKMKNGTFKRCVCSVVNVTCDSVRVNSDDSCGIRFGE